LSKGFESIAFINGFVFFIYSFNRKYRLIFTLFIHSVILVSVILVATDRQQLTLPNNSAKSTNKLSQCKEEM